MNPLTKMHTPGGSTAPCAASTSLMAERDLATHGFFLLPILQRGFHVLDAGCGPGTISMGIAEAVFPGTVTALDQSHAHIEYGQRLAQGREIVNIRFVPGCARALPFADASFDIVFSHALLEHMDDPEGTLREFHRVLRPGGFAAICCMDWDEMNTDACPGEARDALATCRTLHKNRGEAARPESWLKDRMEKTGFTPLALGGWREDGENSALIIGCLARQLESAGEAGHAAALRRWAQSPDASLCQAWKYAVGMRTH